jgi:hypothetical protein
VPDLTISLLGETFALPEQPNPMALMEYASLINSGVHPESFDGLAALHDLLEEYLGGEWPRLRALAKKERVSADDLLDVVAMIHEVYADRPTGRPSDSSDGPTSTEVRSEGNVYGRAKRNLEAKGRPDLAVVVMDAEAAAQAG